MDQLAVIDDMAARRSAAAHKAVATRRARANGEASPPREVSTYKPSNGATVRALAAFERARDSEAPSDWFAVALVLKQALTARPQILTQKLTRPVAIAAPLWPDYAVDHLGSFKVRNPTIVNGEVVRAPAVSAKDKPVNIGRGVRVAIAFYQSRMVHRIGPPRFNPDVRQVPAIVSCVCEDTGEIYDANQCTMRTVETRKGR
jgi:hypothetical protein